MGEPKRASSSLELFNKVSDSVQIVGVSFLHRSKLVMMMMVMVVVVQEEWSVLLSLWLLLPMMIIVQVVAVVVVVVGDVDVVGSGG